MAMSNVIHVYRKQEYVAISLNHCGPQEMQNILMVPTLELWTFECTFALIPTLIRCRSNPAMTLWR